MEMDRKWFSLAADQKLLGKLKLIDRSKIGKNESFKALNFLSWIKIRNIEKKKKSIEMFQIELMLGIGIRHGIGYKRRTLGPIPISRFFSAANQNEWNGIAHCHWSWFYGCKTTANQRPRRKWIARNCHSNSSPFVYPFVIDVRLCYLQWINSIRNSLSSCL